MIRTFLCAGALALSLGGSAMAQRPVNSAPASPPEPAAPAQPTATNPGGPFTPGMPVKDSSGETIGTINRVGRTADGAPAVELNVDGKPVTMALAALTLADAGDHAVTSATKAQVEAAARQNPG